MKGFINTISDPIISFPIVVGLFLLMLKHYRFVGSKKFAGIAFLVSVPLFLWAMQDPNFFAIITWPDNIPISLLLITVSSFTWLALRKCALNDQRIAAGEGPLEGLPENREKVWCWPNLVYTELFAIIAGTIFLIAWGILFKAPLEEPANPTWAPNPAKAPWYFLGLQEMLVYFDPWIAGVVLPGLVIVGLILIPYIDTNPKGNGYFTFSQRKMAISFFLFGWLALWIYLIIIGTFMRGPNWTFYGPFEFWDFHKVVAQNNINLSEIFWIKLFDVSMPKNLLFRELPGIFLTVLYFVLLPWGIERTAWARELLPRVGRIRYTLLLFLILGMTSLPIKMVLRWVINLKYIVALPEWELNI